MLFTKGITYYFKEVLLPLLRFVRFQQRQTPWIELCSQFS